VCLGTALDEVQSAGRGSVYSYTTVWRAPSNVYRQHVPYTVALIDLDEGFRMLAGLQDVPPDDAIMGLRVEVAFAHTIADLILPTFHPLRLQSTPRT